MQNVSLNLPAQVRLGALARGREGAAWLASLDQRVAGLERDWQLSVGDILSGGTEALVVEATAADGEPSVLKITLPGIDPSALESQTLSAANGRGYVRLRRYDARRGALLLERLGAQLHQQGLSISAQIDIICATLCNAWMPLPPGLHLPSGAEKANRLATFIESSWGELGKPCLERTIKLALSFARARAEAFAPNNAVLAHGDAHAWNTLAAAGRDGAPFKFIDPSPVFAEREYDLGIPMREWSAELLTGDPRGLGHERCHQLAKLTDTDPDTIWQWGLIQRVSNGLLCIQDGGLKDEGRKMLEVADAWSR